MSPLWTEENIEKLRQMAGAGENSSQIAAAIRGATRSAIIGKARRMGIALSGNPTNRRRAQPIAPNPEKPQGFQKSRAPKVELPPEPIEIPESLDLPIEAVPPGGCKFPTSGHDAPANGHRFCAAPAGEGPYCPHHSQIASGDLPVRKKPAASAGR